MRDGPGHSTGSTYVSRSLEVGAGLRELAEDVICAAQDFRLRSKLLVIRTQVFVSKRLMPWLVQTVEVTFQICENSRVAQRFQGKPLVDVMPPVMVAFMISTVYFAFTLSRRPLGVVPGLPLLGTVEPWPLGSATPFAVRAAILLASISYHQGLVTDPGQIPDSWREGPEIEKLIAARHLVERKRRTGDPRFCKKERKFKPDRAHYCAAMRRNVLRMDHYCPWLSNCVGYFNHKFFLLFLVYALVATSLALLALLQALANGTFSAGATAAIVGGSGLAAVLVATLGPFLAFHVWLLSKNMTTIEFCEQRFGPGPDFVSPYDIGVWENFQSIFGSNMILWPLPFGAPPGDGLAFPHCKPDCDLVN